MKLILRVFSILLLTAVAMGVAVAQDVQTYEFKDSGASVTYPDKWELTEADDGHIELTIEGITLSIYDSVALETAVDFTEASSPRAAMIDLALEFVETVNTADIETDSVDERDYARLDDEGDDETTSLIVLSMSDDSFGLVQSVGEPDVAEGNEALLLDILASFDVSGGDDEGDDDEEGGLSLNLDEVDLDAVICNVSTTEANTVQVRVGPGTNRTVVSFLPANVDFRVLGKSEADDESLWYRLNKDEAAPDKAVNETWILAEDVTATGECDGVADVAAPPIIPIIVQPTANPDGSVDESNLITPQAGAWSFVFGDIVLSCDDGLVFSFPNEDPPFASTVSGGGDSPLVVDGDVYATAGPNQYTFTSTIAVEGDVLTGTINLTVTSETTMNGTLSARFENCNVSTTLTGTR